MMVAGKGFAGLVAAAEAIRGRPDTSHEWIAGLELAGIGWATVELERAARELSAELGIGPTVWVPAARDALLGARAWSALPPVGGAPAVVLLEPDTEGRLAAALARFGEGVAAVYLRDGAASGTASSRVSAAAPGPLGRARLVLGGPTWGPHVIALERDP